MRERREPDHPPWRFVDWQILRQWTIGHMVINERLHRFQFANGWRELPVVGFFEIDDNDPITLRRENFGMNTYVSRFAELAGS